MAGRLLSSILIIMLSGCAAQQREAREYGTSISARWLLLCETGLWFSNEANEKLCIRRNRHREDTFLITQDAGEFWADTLIAMILVGTLHQGAELVAPLVMDNDAAKLYRAAKHYVRKNYGARASIATYRPSTSLSGGIEFTVEPGDQFPPWAEQSAEMVLASQWYNLVTSQSSNPETMIAKRMPGSSSYINKREKPPTLKALLDKAIASSQIHGRVQKMVRIEVFGSERVKVYLAGTDYGFFPSSHLNH